MDLFDFGSFGDFFGVEAPKEPEKKKAAAPAKKEQAKKGTTTKKATSIKVALPTTIVGRGFAKKVEGDGEKELLDIIKDASETIRQLKVGSVVAFYDKDGNTIYTSVPTTSSAEDTLVEATVDVSYGEYNCSVEIEDISEEGEDVSLKMVQNRFLESMPEYKGITGLYYDSEAGVAVPVFKSVNKEFEGEVIVNINGEDETFTLSEKKKQTEFLSFISEEKKIPKEARLVLQELDGKYYLSYSPIPGKDAAAIGGTSTKKETKKVEIKYPLPCTLHVVNWGMAYSLTPEMFSGKEKITKEELVEVMKNYEKMFNDTSRRMDIYFDEVKNQISVMFVSGTKGAWEQNKDGSDIWDTPCCGLWKMTRSAKALAEDFAKSYAQGMWCESSPHYKYRVTPLAVFKSFFGTELECCTVKRVAYESKVPKIPETIYNQMVDYFREDLTKEAIVRILYNKETDDYIMVKGGGEKDKAYLSYDFSEMRPLVSAGYQQVCEIHSHNTMPAFFSRIDDKDELETMGVFGVMGNLDTDTPSFLLRACCDGVGTKFAPQELFCGAM